MGFCSQGLCLALQYACSSHHACSSYYTRRLFPLVLGGGRSRPDTGTLYRTEFARILGFQSNFTQLLFACTRCCNYDERFILRWRHGW
jgi:hypothetical protein